MTLFIGGPWDGKRRDTQHALRNIVDVAVRGSPPLQGFNVHEHTLVPMGITAVRYRREHMFGVGVFVLEGLTMAEVFHKLMDGYKP